MNKANTLLGYKDAQYAFYLPNSPLLPQNWHHTQTDAIESIIQLNGNHWRKIFTIMAKITCQNHDWKTYRDQFLLKKNEQIHINADILSPTAQIHIISGQSAAEQLNLNLKGFQHINSQTPQKPLKVFQSQLLVPYLDYRQYPNVLIEDTRQYLNRLTLK
ncbi:hypothetical protein [uncultured Shewanella sp.]|uniref:DUF6942 family protein n=1 Tax=uncultured Shewanella sp. TaxID=173975 RepID=UPI00262E7747|nr:hypothetical protein [uncultured Shewanella sp.]